MKNPMDLGIGLWIMPEASALLPMPSSCEEANDAEEDRLAGTPGRYHTRQHGSHHVSAGRALTSSLD